MPQKGAAILGMGVVSAVGMGAKQTAASVKAGMSRFSEISIYDKRFEPFVMALLPDDALPPLEPEIDKVMGLTLRQSRMLRLAAPALQEAVENLPNVENVPLYLGVPEQQPDCPKPVDDAFIQYVSKQSGVSFNTAASKVFIQGRSAGLFALAEAISSLSEAKSKHVIVGGVDTYLDLYLLGTLDMEGRILGSRVMDGFVPGEGAAFLLLASLENAHAGNLSPLALLSQVGTGYEEGHLYSDKPYQGNGMAGTFEKFFQETGIKDPVKEVYSSMNGENHWAKEWGVAHIRNQALFGAEHGMHHPADCFGDTGAASGMLLISLAAIGLSEGYCGGPSLVTCSSDFGDRAAVAVLSV